MFFSPSKSETNNQPIRVTDQSSIHSSRYPVTLGNTTPFAVNTVSFKPVEFRTVPPVPTRCYICKKEIRTGNMTAMNWGDYDDDALIRSDCLRKCEDCGCNIILFRNPLRTHCDLCKRIKCDACSRYCKAKFMEKITETTSRFYGWYICSECMRTCRECSAAFVSRLAVAAREICGHCSCTRCLNSCSRCYTELPVADWLCSSCVEQFNSVAHDDDDEEERKKEKVEKT